MKASRSEIRHHFARQNYPVNAMFGPDIKGLLQIKSAAPIKPSKPQLACDHSLFSDEADQLDLVSWFTEQTEE